MHCLWCEWRICVQSAIAHTHTHIPTDWNTLCCSAAMDTIARRIILFDGQFSGLIDEWNDCTPHATNEKWKETAIFIISANVSSDISLLKPMLNETLKKNVNGPPKKLCMYTNGTANKIAFQELNSSRLKHELRINFYNSQWPHFIDEMVFFLTFCRIYNS